jgi:hypothetical protein
MGLAQGLPSNVNFTFSRATFPLWDFSGDYNLDQLNVVGAGGTLQPLSIPVSITNDLNGRLHGAGSTWGFLGSDAFEADYTVSGHVSGGGNATRVNFSVHFTGSGTIAGQNRRCSGSISYNLMVDPANPALIARVPGRPLSGSFSAAGLGHGPIKPQPDFSMPIPLGLTDPTNAGVWTVSMALQNFQRIGGTATFTINHYVSPSGDANTLPYTTLQANVNGNYSAQWNLEQLMLTGLSTSRGTSLSLKFLPGDTMPVKMTGKALGQTIRFP